MKNMFKHFVPFFKRHIGPSRHDVNTMLSCIGMNSLDSMMKYTIPDSIKTTQKNLNIQKNVSEYQTLLNLKKIMKKNKIFRSHIGLGYYNTITPPVILRNMFQNPAWYTPYTPYQAEIAQGRLEMLLNFQTMITELTGLPIANSSLLDESTAAAEAVKMCFAQSKGDTFLISESCFPQTINVIKTKGEVFGVKIKVVKNNEFDFSNENICGILLQYPNRNGNVEDYSQITKDAKSNNVNVVVAADLLALTLLKPPGEWGANIVVGSAQRFGVSMGYGGPHAGYMSVEEKFKRKIPGRIIGVSKDIHGNKALRMALQPREQHIKRERATSNICTAQALLANMSAAYGIYHGPKGLKQISQKIHYYTQVLANALSHLNLNVISQYFFDTLHICSPNITSDIFIEEFLKHNININKINEHEFSIALDETTTSENVIELVKIFETVLKNYCKLSENTLTDNIFDYQLDNIENSPLGRTSKFMTHDVFNRYHSETEMLRYLYNLERKDMGLGVSMIPLGSCTMKLNATSEMIPVTWEEVANIHPFVPTNQVEGYNQLIKELEKDLAEILKFHAVSLQPNSGAQGEFTGLMCIRAFHKNNNQSDRNICLIPLSAHGTNPASAVLAGMKVQNISLNEDGSTDIEDLKEKIKKHGKDKIGALMITYPSTHGVFETNVKEVCKIIHDTGGLVYLDGANLNAQIGYTSPGEIGADVCHINLHKTFSIPHGGGGPGMGPIGVTKELTPFLPDHHCIPNETSIGPVAGAPYSSASILPITWMYIRMMGPEGLKRATSIAILNANYVAHRLKEAYDILHTGENGLCGHEFIIDLRKFKKLADITEEDIAKRLQDFNIHAPTMSWPVPGTIMIEPTESESKRELDRFCKAMITIRSEIDDIINGKSDRNNNVLKGAPHTADSLIKDDWKNTYSREQAAYPLSYLKTSKFWPSVGRIDNVYGDVNFMCQCPPMSEYIDD